MPTSCPRSPSSIHYTATAPSKTNYFKFACVYIYGHLSVFTHTHIHSLQQLFGYCAQWDRKVWNLYPELFSFLKYSKMFLIHSYNLTILLINSLRNPKPSKTNEHILKLTHVSNQKRCYLTGVRVKREKIGKRRVSVSRVWFFLFILQEGRIKGLSL